MRMTDFPVLSEIREEYVQLRQLGNNRARAVEKLMESYKHVLAEDMEDAQLFWIGLADVQYSRKELTDEAARKALEALDKIAEEEWPVPSGDLRRRRERYVKAPMPERNAGKTRVPFRCPWQVGDTFALQLRNREAAELNISGKYMLLRKVAESECSGGMYPVVTVSFWEGENPPKDRETFLAIPPLKLQIGGRCFSPKDKFEYRTVIFIKNLKQLNSMALQYCGNFADVPMPSDEIIFHLFGETMITLADTLEEDLILYWKRNKNIDSVPHPQQK